MKSLLLLLFPLLVITSSCHRQKETSVDIMTFYSGYGYPASNSIVMYRLNRVYLVKDDSAQFTPGYVFHTTQVMNTDKYVIAKELIDHVPVELVSSPGITFGSPGSHDQTGYVVVIEKGGRSERFDIDADDTPDQSKGVLAFKQRLADVLNKLK
jgi:hypothetical protein